MCSQSDACCALNCDPGSIGSLLANFHVMNSLLHHNFPILLHDMTFQISSKSSVLGWDTSFTSLSVLINVGWIMYWKIIERRGNICMLITSGKWEVKNETTALVHAADELFHDWSSHAWQSKIFFYQQWLKHDIFSKLLQL